MTDAAPPPRPAAEKILPRDRVAEICRELRRLGKRIGFTSGAYDLLHAGHADFLERARALCDALVVAVNTDDSVRQYKGPTRPIVPEAQRARLIAALEAVDYVFLFSERRNARNIEVIEPDLYIKAGDYAKSALTSAEEIEKRGGQVILLPIEFATSTTDLARRAAASLAPPPEPCSAGILPASSQPCSAGILPASSQPCSAGILPASSQPCGAGVPPAHTPVAQISRSADTASADQPPAATSSSSLHPSSFILHPSPTIHLPTPPPKTAPAVFLDRDGTINREIEYLHDPDRFELLPGAGEGIRRFADMGYRIVIVTTQAGIGLGYFTHEDFYAVNRAMFRALKPHGVAIDRIYYCPHSVTEKCACRKPATALFERAASDLHLDLAHSVCIGDKTTDLEAGRRLGLTTILVRTGHAGADAEYPAQPDHTADDLTAAARWILDRERKGQDRG